MLNQKYGAFIEPGSDFTVLFIITGIVAYFVFLTTLIREIIKDLQDFEGDYAIDRNTMPIIIGVKFTKAVIASLIILVIISIFYVFFKYLNNIYSLCYFVILLIIPLIFLIYKIFAANNKKMYGAASMLTKLIMIAGMLYFIYIQIVEKLLPV